MTTQDVAEDYDPQPAISAAVRSLLAQRSRTNRELSQAKGALASEIGMKPGTLDAKLRDERRWSIEDVHKLARYFRKPVDDLYGDSLPSRLLPFDHSELDQLASDLNQLALAS